MNTCAHQRIIYRFVTVSCDNLGNYNIPLKCMVATYNQSLATFLMREF